MLKKKNILVMGMGLTGISAVKCLNDLGANVYAYDEYKDLKKLNSDFLIYKDADLEKIDFILKSPGIKKNDALLLKAEEKNIEILSDIELFYRITKHKNIIAITGTNGKTTMTSLIGCILNKKRRTHVVGNIGNPILDIVKELREDDYVVVEASSFQLHYLREFKPKIAIISYISSDHLDWHESLSDYVDSKLNIFRAQDNLDFSILNLEDENLRDISVKSKKYYFSDKRKADAYVDGNDIFVNGKYLMDKRELNIPGNHNLRNILAASICADILKVNTDTLANALKNFRGVEHRIEFVKEIDNKKYYNDSKGTNPDSTRVAIEAMNGDTVLIAGGYNKGSDFSDLFVGFENKLKAVILLGETAKEIAKHARALNIEIIFVRDMKSAVKVASELDAKNVLLSPACASWDMYKSYIERGEHFKECLKEYE